MIAQRAALLPLVVLATQLAASSVVAHGDAEWIQRSKRFSFCCGPNDCHRVPAATVRMNGVGYVLLWRGASTVIPFEHAYTSENEHFWLCEDPRQIVRCFFAPPLGS